MKPVVQVALAAALAGLTAAVITAQDASPAPAPAPELDLTAVLERDAADIQDDLGAAAPGDLREFKIVTDDDIRELEVDDIYKSNSSYFKVVRIDRRDEKGGRFAVQRTSGANDPLRTFNRVSGLGPAAITARETLISRFLSGGVLMYPIALLLLGVIVILLNSLWIYRRGKQCPATLVTAVRSAIRSRDVTAVESLARAEKGLLAAVCRAMVIDFDISEEEDIRMRCESEARRQIGFLRIPLRSLNFVAAVAPLLGLLGTVIGMIACFDSLSAEAASASKAQAMAGGIKVALLTTAFGLIVAVPALLIFFIFNQRLNGITADCENYTTEFVHKLALMKRDAADRGGE